MSPRLVTFDVFGTVLDWRSGLARDCAAAGRPLGLWHAMGGRRGIVPGPAWWHVSAYADYDLAVANAIGLTTVFVARPHARPGPATHRVGDLSKLAILLECPTRSPL